MFTYTDQMGNTMHLRARPLRVISIVPSQSELLWHLGLREELIGITKFCIHPNEMFTTVARVGGTKNLDLEKIRSMAPDLVIGNMEENEREQIETLSKEFNVWMSNITDFTGALDMIRSLGEIFDKTVLAHELAEQIGSSLGRIKNIFEGQRVAYFIWNKPYMLAAGNTYIDHVLNHLGLRNAASNLSRYPEIGEHGLAALDPDLCFLSSEPFPFKQAHVSELGKKLPGSKIMIVDGEPFSWYGSRLLQLETYVKALKEAI